jgi:NAD(P)-dependent dehydrogenase (short-subunit alcohol dehydrogenase family)
MAKRTGYPVEALGLDVDVEVELGIDTVKQLAVLRQVCQHFGVTLPGSVRLREVSTLRKAGELIRKLVSESQPSETRDAQPAPAAPVARPPSYAIPSVKGPLQAARHVLEAVPSPIIRQLERRFRFEGKRVLLTVDPFGIWQMLQARLEQLGAKVVRVYPHSSGWSIPAGAYQVNLAAPEQVRELMRRIESEVGVLDGIFLLHALSPEVPFTELSAEDWRRIVDQSALCSLAMLQPLYDRLETGFPGESFFVVPTRMGGCLGVAARELHNPVCGSYAGFVKSVQRELPGTLFKVIDFEELHPVEQVAERILEEVLFLDPRVEVGYVDDVRHTLALARKERPAQTPLAVDSDWVFVVSGGGRGVVAEVVRQLAEQFNPSIYITGRTPLPTGQEPWLEMSEVSFLAWRATFFAAERARDPNLKVPQLEQRYESFKRIRELHRNLRVFKDLGARVHYRVCDVTSASEVEALVADIRARHGRIDAVVHGAMVEESRVLPRKTDALYRNTFAAKLFGALHLMRATRQDRLKAFINFGSGASRFGNHGQSDYAAAGDLLVKATQLYRRELSPGTRCVTIDWPAWLGAGWVASNPEIERRLREVGVGTFIELDEGVAWFMGELLYGGDAEEVVIASEKMVGQLASPSVPLWEVPPPAAAPAATAIRGVP